MGCLGPATAAITGSLNESPQLRALARQGAGLIYAATLAVAPDVEAGVLEPMLEKGSPAQGAILIYCPRASRSHPKLRAFIDSRTRGL